MGQAKKEVPRWKKRPAAHAGPVIQMNGRQAKKLAAQMSTALTTSTAQKPAVPAPRVLPSGTLARSGAYRFRRHLPPFGLLLGIVTAGLGLRAQHSGHADVSGIVLGVLGAAALWFFTRHLSPFARKAGKYMAALCLIWLPVLALAGDGWWTPIALATWLGLMVKWARRYRWRPESEKKPDVIPADAVIWDRLAAKNKWIGQLGALDQLPGGGRQYPIVLNGAETHIGQVMTEPRRIAAAWGKSVTEAYVEPDPSGVESRGLLTILSRNTLATARVWDGKGIDLEAGMAVVGRFPDGKPVHERYLIRRNGVRHTVVAGADGSGKSGLLDLGLSLSATSGIIAPVILDPQEGQALPAWKDHVLYACGVEECMAYVRGLHAALFDRSRLLASLTWENDEGEKRKGMGFFDPFMTGLPIIEVTLDEAPALLTHDKFGNEAGLKLAEIGKLGRKAGFRLRIAIQVPSLSEFGGNAQPLRSMLVGGNVFCGRTGDRVSGGMLGVAADPSELPKYFADGKPTVGLGYASGPDNRPSTPVRLDWIPDPYKVAASASIRSLDDRCAEAMDRAMGRQGSQLAMPHAAPAPLAAVAPSGDDKPGRTAADAVLAVLDREMAKGEIIAAATALVETEWQRPKPFVLRSWNLALSALSDENKISHLARGSYAPVKASLHSVPQSAPAATEASR